MDPVEEQLTKSKVIAIVGLSPRPERDSYDVARYLKEQGYRIIPVNPTVDEVLGEKSYPDLKSVPEPIDMVDIFRRSELVAPVVDEAIADGVPVVFVDTKGINKGVTYIGTDNKAGAALAAKLICDNVPAGSDVAILQGIVTQSTGKARADGAHNGLTACGLNIVAEQTGEWDRAKGLAVMENILTANPNLRAVFASNDNMGLGAIEALKSDDMLDKVFVVGFDANPDAAASVLAGEMSATIAQNPYNMGALGVESVLKLMRGGKLDPVIDTGTVLVDKSNAADFM